jgi:hypothetical protein
MFTPLAQYAVQVVREIDLAEAKAAHRRRLARQRRQEQAAKSAQRSAPVTAAGRLAAADAG